MKVITLKTLPQYFKAVKTGTKNFEIRKNDRDYQVGDMLRLTEYDANTDTYSGEILKREVTYITDYGQPEGQVVLGLKVIE